MKILSSITLSVSILTLFAGCATSRPSKKAIATETKRQIQSLEPLTLNTVFQTQDICAGSPIPNGWIITGGRWCPTCCGGTPGGAIYNNVLTITRYDNLPNGTVLAICAGQATPNGWVVVGGSWCPTCCGGTQGGTIYNNVLQIKRIN